jgi:hypothetical protein
MEKPMTNYSSAESAVDAIGEQLRGIHRSFSGAQVRVAHSVGDTGPKFLTGTLTFAEQELACRPKVCYPELHLSEFWINGQDETLAFLRRLLKGGELIGGVPSPEFKQTLVNHDLSGDSTSGWPSWVYSTSKEYRQGEQPLYLSQSPLVQIEQEPFRTSSDAVRRWVYGEIFCDQLSNGVPNQEHFLTIVPDTRARFASGRWRSGRLELSIETGVNPCELELQIIRLGSSARSSRHIVTADPLELDLPEEATALELYLVHRCGDLIARRTLHARYRTFGMMEDDQPEATNYALELQGGENERREFKPFMMPKHEKEFDVVKTVVAFANTEGGTLFVGVDDEGTPQGQAAANRCFRKSGDPVKDQMQMLKKLVIENTKPVPGVLYTVAEINGHPVIVMEVSKTERICAAQDNRVFVRRGATSRLADPHTEIPSMVAAVTPGG